jgi:chromodomain-helicase-DNA-binding protein 1
VSKFTEFDAKKLFKLYKHAVKKDQDKKGPEKKVKEKGDDEVKTSESKEGNHNRALSKRRNDEKDSEKDTHVTPVKRPYVQLDPRLVWNI